MSTEKHTVQNLMYNIRELLDAKLTYQQSGTIAQLQYAVDDSAKLARESILTHSFKSIVYATHDADKITPLQFAACDFLEKMCADPTVIERIASCVSEE